MRPLIGIFALLLAACAPQEAVEHKTSVNVDLAVVPAFLSALDRVTDSDIDVAGLVALSNSVSMDEEKQERFAVTIDGQKTELLYHVWREQADWVHVYLSSPSEKLIAEAKTVLTPFARSEGGE